MARKEIYGNGNQLRVVTLCSGYDSQCLAINRLGIPYELVAWSEIDKYAIQAHDALFPQWADRNLGDMTKIDWAQVPDFDKIQAAGISNSQLYKMAGNSIVTNVLAEIFRKLFVDTEKEYQSGEQMSLF